MYGHRARIGYTSPPMVTEVFAYEFYKVAPPGVTLALTTLAMVAVETSEELDTSVRITRLAAQEMARAGVDLLVLGGIPVNLATGPDGDIESVTKAWEAEFGIPITSSLTAQLHALSAVGARRVAVVTPNRRDARGATRPGYVGQLAKIGCEVVVIGGGVELPLVAYGRVPAEVPLQAARELKKAHPEADTLYFPCPHWAMLDNIEVIENELHVNVVGAHQAIMWEALRRCNIAEPIPGCGHLLQEH